MEELARVNLCVEEHGEAGDGSDSEEGSVWSGGSDSGGGSADEEVAVSSCEGKGAPSDTESLDEDTSINSFGADLQVEIQSLIAADPCEARCLRGKEVPLGNLICSVSQMTNAERKQSILTALGVLRETDTAVRRRGKGEREAFFFYLPLVGRVCRETWCACFKTSTASVTRYRKQISEGRLSLKPHGNMMNQHASKVDVRWLVKWFRSFAAEVGTVVPVRVRTKEVIDGKVRKYYSSENHTMFPAFFTWDRLYDEMHNYVEEYRLFAREPQPSTFRKLLQKLCPDIQIRSPRSNVCDVCSIYYTKMRSCVTPELTEELGRHTEAARQMRNQYNIDIANASDDHGVIIMDFSQNLTLPSVSETPSQWYFLSLVSVSCFGIYYVNKEMQYNYTYQEKVAGKGSDEVNSLLHHFIRTVVCSNGHKRLSIYADNCGGQNKNNFVVRLLLALVHKGTLERVDLNFFVKGHTKNAVDRGFAHIRKKASRVDIWTWDHMVEIVNSIKTTAIVPIERENSIFHQYKSMVNDLYKSLSGIKQYQLFSMTSDAPGTVPCRVGPDSTPLLQDIRRRFDGIFTNDTKVCVMFDEHLEPLSPPPVNSEKCGVGIHLKFSQPKCMSPNQQQTLPRKGRCR